MPRSETRLDPTRGPLAAFASQLREARAASGLTYRELAYRAHYSPAALARAAGAERLPSWEIVRAYVVACGADDQDLAEWLVRWKGTAAALGVTAAGAAAADADADADQSKPPNPNPSLADCARREDLARELRRATQAVNAKPMELARRAGVSRSSVYAYLNGTALPPVEVLDRIVVALGVTPQAQRAWADARDRVAEGVRSAANLDRATEPAVNVEAAESASDRTRRWTRNRREQREVDLHELLVRRFTAAFFVGLSGLFVLIILKTSTYLVNLWGSALLAVATLLAITIRYYSRRK
jgi:transcriptional regulator with XRE-family HTH domain